MSPKNPDKEVEEISKKIDVLQRALANARGELEVTKLAIQGELDTLQKKVNYLLKT